MWFNQDFQKIGELLLPTFLRGAKMRLWVRGVILPIQMLHHDFIQFRGAFITGTNYRLSHNSQVCRLRKALNDRFDPKMRRIYLSDGNQFKRKYIYTRSEQKPKFLGKMFLRQREDYADTGVDFIVHYPAGLVFNSYEFKAFVDYYKLASKRYKIIDN